MKNEKSIEKTVSNQIQLLPDVVMETSDNNSWIKITLRKKRLKFW